MGIRAPWAQPRPETERRLRQAFAPDVAALLLRDTTPGFHELMDRAMLTSAFKYGAVEDAYPERVDAVATLHLRLDTYLHGKPNPLFGIDEDEPEFLIPPGNVEQLVDVANMAMIEFMCPRHPRAHYTPTDASGSPGRIAQNTTIYESAVQFKNTDIEAAE